MSVKIFFGGWGWGDEVNIGHNQKKDKSVPTRMRRETTRTQIME